MHILAIDSSQADLVVLKMALLSSNLASLETIVTADNWGAAIERLQESPFDVIVCAQEIPDHQKSLRHLHQQFSETPVVALLNHPGQVGVETFYFGVQDYLVKGHYTDHLIRHVLEGAVARAKSQTTCRGQHAAEELIHKAEQASKAKTKFLANMSHEIRTPLNLIIGIADLLQASQLSVPQQKMVDTFSAAGNHLLTLINDVLEISQLESQEISCLTEEFSLEKSFYEVCEVISMSCRAKKVNFDCYFDREIPLNLIGDSRRIRQVMFNLLNNAVKFTEKGLVTLSVTREPGTAANLCALRIRVQDTGIGIPKAEFDKIFENFYQVDARMQRKFGGSGVGLAIVKSIVDFYGGRIDVQSTENAGTQFDVFLTLSTDGRQHESSQCLTAKKILLMLHGSAESQSTLEYLSRNGAMVDVARSGMAAQAKLVECGTSYDWIILDLVMADRGALTILNSVSADPTKVVIVKPPLHRKDDINQCLRLGVTNLIYKPLSAAKLEATLLPASCAQPNDPIQKVQNQTLRILVVDDDSENRELMRAYLAGEYQVAFATSGPEAITALSSQKFDVVFMDIQMPEMDGYLTTQNIRQLPEGSSIVILGLSANAFRENLEMAKAHGLSGYITKPVRRSTILQAIQSARGYEGFYIGN